MYRSLIMVSAILTLALSSCHKDDNCGCVSQRFVHKYGFELTAKEWKKLQRDGQIIDTLEIDLDSIAFT